MNDGEKPSIKRNEGLTPSERYLKRLCERTFLSLWSYPGLYVNHGSSKELCDLLVVCGKHIIIFSDKACAFPDTGDEILDWSRWFHRAIEKSAKQIWRAEHWLMNKSIPIFLDRSCSQPFPFPIPEADSAIVHRVVVAHGVKERCQQFYNGGNGSLMINTAVIGNAHINEVCFPFSVGIIDDNKGFIHVLDDYSLDIVLNTIDTITDFVEYLSARETFLSGKQIVFAAGEEELLACYLTELNDQGKHDFVFPPDLCAIMIEEGSWDKFTVSKQREAQVKENEVSYAWDGLIERFSKHILAGTQYYSTSDPLIHGELLMRFLAQQSRTERRTLVKAILDIDVKSTGKSSAVRVIRPTKQGSPFFVFLLFSKRSGMPENKYRDIRLKLLHEYCMVTKIKFPFAEDIVGIASQPLSSRYSSEDVVYVNGRTWSQTDQEEAERFQKEHGILQNVTPEVHIIEYDYPEHFLQSQSESSTTSSKSYIGRNELCPCGSGKKYKRCCLSKH